MDGTPRHAPGCGCRDEAELDVLGDDLARFVDTGETVAYNATDESTAAEAAKTVVRPYGMRLEDKAAVEAEDSDGVLLVVAFTAPLKLLSFSVIPPDEDSTPSHVAGTALTEAAGKIASLNRFPIFSFVASGEGKRGAMSE